jgi:hypothetical protein
MAAFQPGQVNNPAGRPKAVRGYAAQLARYIADQTRDGFELVDRLLELSRAEAHTAPLRNVKRAATEALLERLAGKAPITVDVDAKVSGADQALESLTPETEAQLEAALRAVLAENPERAPTEGA